MSAPRGGLRPAAEGHRAAGGEAWAARCASAGSHRDVALSPVLLHRFRDFNQYYFSSIPPTPHCSGSRPRSWGDGISGVRPARSRKEDSGLPPALFVAASALLESAARRLPARMGVWPFSMPRSLGVCPRASLIHQGRDREAQREDQDRCTGSRGVRRARTRPRAYLARVPCTTNHYGLNLG